MPAVRCGPVSLAAAAANSNSIKTPAVIRPASCMGRAFNFSEQRAR
jgi:hypothetical protein